MAQKIVEDTSFNPNWSQHGECCNGAWRRNEWGCVPVTPVKKDEDKPADEEAA